MSERARSSRSRRLRSSSAAGAAADAGWELERLGVKRAMLVSDPGMVAAGITDRVRRGDRGRRASRPVVCRPRARRADRGLVRRRRPTFAVDGGFDGFVGLGGGSSHRHREGRRPDRHPRRRVMDYVNPPVGEGRKPPAPLKPLLAIPTTCGHGRRGDDGGDPRHPRAEGQDAGSRTATCGRTRRIVDPSLTRVAAAPRSSPRAGSTSICHAAESFIAKPYDARDAPESPGRPAALPGRDADLRHLVGEGARVRRALPARARSPADDSRRAAR